MEKRSLLLALSCACTSDPKDPGDSASTCENEEEVEGVYVPGGTDYDNTSTSDLDYCLQAPSLQEGCEEYNLLSRWWQGPGCPSFQDYAAYVFHVAGPQLLGVFSVRRCSANGVPYDVISYSPVSDSLTTDTWSTFSTSGEMLSYEYSRGILYDDTRYCCEGRPTFGLLWGERIELDCSNATLYTADDFPDSADTGDTSYTADTGAVSTTETAETADTGLP